MIFSTLQENLLAGLKVVAPAVAKGSTLPVLSNVLLQAEGDKVALTANNLDMSVSTVIGAKTEKAGAITLPFKLLYDLVGSLPAERIDAELNEETLSMALKCARYTSTVKGLDAWEFPAFQDVTGIEVPLAYDTLQNLAAQVAICAATDIARPVFTAVWLQIREDTLTSAAADGFRLGRIYTNGLKISPEEFAKLPPEMAKNNTVEALVPAKILTAIAAISKLDDEEPIFMTVGERSVKFVIGATTIYCNTMNGDYPDIDRIIPTKTPITVQVGAAELRSALKIVRLFARDSANICRLEINPDSAEIMLKGVSAELGDTETPVAAFVQGVTETFFIAFNVVFFQQAVDAISAPQILLKMSTSSSPGVLSAAGSESYINVIMPMHINE